MTQFQNTNVVFRCPMSLKKRMKASADSSEVHLSAFIRSACAEKLSREREVCANIDGLDAVEKRLWEINRLNF